MRSGFTRFTSAFIAVLVLVGTDVTVLSQTAGVDRSGSWDRPPTEDRHEVPLGDVDIPQARRQSLTTPWGMPGGEPLSFLQTPPILRPDHGGAITLSKFALLGDYPTVTFERADDNATSGSVVEQWDRTGKTTITGRTVSLFEPRWSRRVWSRRLQHERYGFDRPYIYWGRVLLPTRGVTSFGTPRQTRPVYLRVGSTAIPSSRVRRIATDVQYASHVVNLVVPGFGDTRVLSGSYKFDLPAVANTFYAYFSDSYDSIAFIPQRSQVAEYGGFHRNIRNDVEGIGKPLLNQSHIYGSTG